MMAMEGALGFAGRKNCQVVAKILGSDVIAYLAAARSVEAILFASSNLTSLRFITGLITLSSISLIVEWWL